MGEFHFWVSPSFSSSAQYFGHHVFWEGYKWPYSYCFVGCSFQNLFKTTCSFLLAFSPGISLKSKWCDCTLVMIWLQFGRIPILSEISDFHMVVSRSTAVHVLPMSTLASISVDEILITSYRNWSTNFSGTQLNPKMMPFCFIWVHREANAFGCLLQAMLQRFNLHRCISEKC